MDINFAYNVERLLYYMTNENPEILSPIMSVLDDQFSNPDSDKPVGKLDLIILNRIKEIFSSASISDTETLSTIRSVFEESDILLCPHSAVGVAYAKSISQQVNEPIICVLTAHPIKFANTIVAAIGKYPYVIPEHIQLMPSLPKRFETLKKESVNWRFEWVEYLKQYIIQRNPPSEG